MSRLAFLSRFGAAIAVAGGVLLTAGVLSMALASGDTVLPAASGVLGVLLVLLAAVVDREMFQRYGRWLNA
ncbi:MAG: hypothetical protein VYB08_10550, partial [Candidatus Latescibacterota bacterium]|nr:hypothetical protein [Candidatus Latescibacterota bacterium]